LDFELPDECQAITDCVRRIVESEIRPAIAAHEASGEFPYSIIRPRVRLPDRHAPRSAPRVG
jgi:hypothetical protein